MATFSHYYQQNSQTLDTLTLYSNEWTNEHLRIQELCQDLIIEDLRKIAQETLKDRYSDELFEIILQHSILTTFRNTDDDYDDELEFYFCEELNLMVKCASLITTPLITTPHNN